MNVVWLKRDLRLVDNKVLFESLKSYTICMYVFEPSVSYNYDWDIRHWRFIYQSLIDLQQKGLKIHLFYGEALDIFKFLINRYQNLIVYSHMETGNDLTYKRDISLCSLFKTNDVKWIEYQNNLVLRGLKDRAGWDARWIKKVKAPLFEKPNLENSQYIDDLKNHFPLSSDLLDNLKEHNNEMIRGGESLAQKALNEFLQNKVENYWGSISYPEKAKYYCSFLSAYLSWGNISIRQIYHQCQDYKPRVRNKTSLNQFMTRLKWHCHFIQKLEMQPELEFVNINPAFNNKKEKR